MANIPPKRIVTPMDEWSIREQLALASAVLRSGDQNWASVSRMIKVYGEKNRPSEWFSQKNCARQYSALLDKVEKPKRKRGGTETTGESIVRNLTEERVKELKFLIAKGRDKYIEMSQEVKDIEGGVFDNSLEDFSDDIKSDSDMESDISESSATNRLSESCTTFDEDKTLKPVDKKLDDRSDGVVPGDSIVVSSIAESDATVFEKSSASVSSTPKKANSSSPNVSPQLKNLVHTAIAGASEDDRPKTMSPTASAPTLSMLLEMPPRDRGQPLPELPSLMSSPSRIPIGESDLIEMDIRVIPASGKNESTHDGKSSNHVNDVEIKEEFTSSKDSETGTVQIAMQTIKDEIVELPLPVSVSSKIDPVAESLKSSDNVEKEIPMDTNVPHQPNTNNTIVEVPFAINIETNKPENSVYVGSKDKASEEVKLPSIYSKSDEPTKIVDRMKKNDESILKKVEDDISVLNLIHETLIKDITSGSGFLNSQVGPTGTEKTDANLSKDVKEINFSHKIEVTIADSSVDKQINANNTIVSSPRKSNVEAETIVPKTVIDEPRLKSPEKDFSSEPLSSKAGGERVVEPSPSKSIDKDKDIGKDESNISSGNKPNQTNIPESSENIVQIDSEPKSLSPSMAGVTGQASDSSTVASTEIVADTSKSEETTAVTKPTSSDQEQEPSEKAKNHYIGRGKKAFAVTIVENERGEKVELKTPDGASIKVTRNLSKETGLKIEDLPYSKKAAASKEDSVSVPSSPSKKRGSARTSTVSESSSKEVAKTPSSTPQTSSRQIGSNKKSPSKVPNSEIKTPNLRSRGGPIFPPTPTKEDPEKQNTSSDTKNPVTETDNDKKEDVKAGDDKKDSATHTPVKPVDEHVTEPVKEKKEKEFDESEYDFTDVVSDIESGKSDSDSEDDADESDSSRKVGSEKSGKSRKERLESADMADDDSSNSAHDAATKKRVTRRSVKSSPIKSKSKSSKSDKKGLLRQKFPWRLSSPAKDKDSKSEVKSGRSSKALIRVKHLSEEASLIYGDLDTQAGDSSATRVTRARAKTTTTPTPTTTSVSKNVTPSSEPETSSDTESKARSTRSRTAAATVSSTSVSVIDQLPPVPIDSNPSSPCSSTTNSTIIDEDKDQRAFRKSIMLVWNRIAAHKFSSLFLKAISEDKAPGYLEKVKRPMDLATIKRNVETGLTRSVKTFERDIYIMFMNAMMFNPIEHEVSAMSGEMERDVRAILDEHQKMLKLSSEGGDGSMTPISERMLRRDSRVLFPPAESSLPNTRLSDSEPEMKEEKPKTPNASNSRKRRAGSKESETSDSKKRKTRTSVANSSLTRKIKPQVSPDIVSASYDL